MSNKHRNIDILEKIIDYCDQIEEANRRCGNSLEDLASDTVYKNAVAMCVLQIGELAGHLSEEFRNSYTGAPWRDIRGMRNIAAHSYGSFDTGKLWETVTEDIPGLRQYCQEIIGQYQLLEQEAVSEQVQEPDMSL